ncbi:uridylate kinase [Chelatococcus sp. GCM10030263]|uniref:amino acid kinase family protein n=1 Tax=Chelatococcus sp. GCM10030263 TaxID=3273387 RepID=UPI0036226AB4
MNRPEKPTAVVKIGGSLYGTARLDRVVAEVLAAPVPSVIVPGGGPFADAVREAQRRLGFDDRLAHRLALDAMAQAAEALAARHARLVVAATAAEIAAAHGAGLIPIWQPHALRAGHPDIPESWDVTSDSLALWLATLRGAARLVLVKSLDVASASPAALAAAGIVDAAFPVFAARYDGDIVIAGPAADASLSALIAGTVAKGAQAA